MKPDRNYVSGFTFRSVAVSLFCFLLAGAIIQFAGVTDKWARDLGSEPLSPAALIPFLVILLVAAAMFALSRFRFLTRAEMAVVMFSSLIAAPLMSHGLWRHMLAASVAIPRGSQFSKIDMISPKLWPHGPNVLEGMLARGDTEATYTTGNVTWREVEVAEGQPSKVVVLENDSIGQVSAVRIRLPVDSVQLNVPYIVSVQARARGLGAQARYYGRVYHDGNETFDEEVYTSRQLAQRTYVQKSGFVRVGKYGVRFSPHVQRYVELELGLEGKGAVELHDAYAYSVSAIEDAYLGRKIISEDDYARLQPYQRVGLTVKPDNMLSIDGLKFILAGHFPVRQWLPTVTVWGLFVLLLLSGTFAVGVIMRRQWVQNERYPLPVAQVPFALLEPPEEGRFLPPVLRRRELWTGFAITLFWCIIRIAHDFNSAFPSVEVSFPLKPYFTDAGWGDTWKNVNFAVYGLFLGIGLFMELNVLMSLVVGYFLFRFQYWFGETYSLTTISGYPFQHHQSFGSYLVYALLVIVFTRKYLWRVLKMAVKGERGEGEPMSYRSAFLLLFGSVVAIIGWAKWAGLPAPGMVAFFVFMLLIGFVAAKLRAECGPGTIYSKFTTGMLFLVPTLGGLAFFEAPGVIFLSLAGLVFGFHFCIMMVSGMQIELMEAGRRVGIRPRHLVYTSMLGVIGGIVVGGWVYLSSVYSIGADQYPLKSAHFEAGGANFKDYNTEVARATEQMKRAQAGEQVPAKIEPHTLAALLAGGATAIVTILRQLFAGFWFHPIGLILGPTGILNQVWGSLLLAWLIRFIVLRLGGAASVREKLLPFATGVFLASVSAYALALLVNGYVFFFSPGGQQFIADFF